MPMELLHDSRDLRYRSPYGAQPCGGQVDLRLRVTGAEPEAVTLRLWFGKESFLPMQPVPGDPTLYEASVRMPETPCLLWYDFQVWAQGQFCWYGNAADGLGGVGAQVWGAARSFQITVYNPSFQAPGWTRGAVFYQIFPDRFARASTDTAPVPMEGRAYHRDWDETPELAVDPTSGDNTARDFFGGTLAGIREKLPYLASLGITALYLNPIFYAGTNHRFDTIDWQTIDPLLGNEEDFRRLCQEADEHGIRIVLDGVFSHAGRENAFFADARAVENSPYRNWFEFEHWPDMYKSWWGVPTLPNLNKHQPAVIDYFLRGENAVTRKWVRSGAGGWRIDVADELPMEYLKLLRSAVKAEKPDALVLGEVWEDASNKVSYGQMRCYCLGDTLDGVMNYPLRDAAIGFVTGAVDAAHFKRRMDSLYENYPAPFACSLLNLLGSHDRPRILNVLSGADGHGLPREAQRALRLSEKQRGLGGKRLRLLLQLTIAMPGMPCVYYGDEAGMEGTADPFNRTPYPWGHEDHELIRFFQAALARRREVPALWDGSLRIEAIGADIVCVIRQTETQTAYTAVNRSSRIHKVAVGNKQMTLPAYGWCVWEESVQGESLRR